MPLPQRPAAESGIADLMARLRQGLPGGHAGLAALLVVLLVGFTVFVPNFLSVGTLQSFMYQLPLLGLLSLAMVVPLITGGLNLAIIATTNQCALLMVWIMRTMITADAARRHDLCGRSACDGRRPPSVSADRAHRPERWSPIPACIRSW